MSISSLNNSAYNPYQITPVLNPVAQESNQIPDSAEQENQNNFAIGEQNSAQTFKQDSQNPGNSAPSEQEKENLKEKQQAKQDEETQQVLEQLRSRDREVRAHEQAHLAAAGSYARGGINFEFETGPDGNKYAVGGNVQIDTSPISGDPEATIQKAQVVKQAAMAPAEPSSQDRTVAAEASKMEMEARSEILSEEIEAKQEKDDAEEVAQNPVAAGLNPNQINPQNTIQPGLVVDEFGADKAKEADEEPAEPRLVMNQTQATQTADGRNPNQGESADFSNPDRNSFEVRLSMQAS